MVGTRNACKLKHSPPLEISPGISQKKSRKDVYYVCLSSNRAELPSKLRDYDAKFIILS